MCKSGLLQNAALRQLSGMETEDADMFGPNFLGLAMLLTPSPAPAAAAQPFPPLRPRALQMLLQENAQTGHTNRISGDFQTTLSLHSLRGTRRRPSRLLH